MSWNTYVCFTVVMSTGNKKSEQNEILVPMRFEPPTSRLRTIRTSRIFSNATTLLFFFD